MKNFWTLLQQIGFGLIWGVLLFCWLFLCKNTNNQVAAVTSHDFTCWLEAKFFACSTDLFSSLCQYEDLGDPGIQANKQFERQIIFKKIIVKGNMLPHGSTKMNRVVFEEKEKQVRKREKNASDPLAAVVAYVDTARFIVWKLFIWK